VLLAATTILGGLSAAYVFITPTGEQTFLAGQAWSTYASQNAEVANLVDRLLSLLGLLGMGFAAGAAIVALVPYRRGERWAWYALWLVPVTYGAVAVRQLSDEYPVGYFYAALAALAVLALLLGYRNHVRASQPE
jgi:hypothetical protein